jgi:glycosyltransferase involved in cell wall biosynthesis
VRRTIIREVCDLKIALCSDWVYPSVGGVQSHIMGLAVQLKELGHEVIIVTKEMDREDLGAGYPGGVRRVEAKRLTLPEHVLAPPNPDDLRKLLKREDFDVVHAHHAFTPTPLLSLDAARRLGVPSVLTNHSITFASSSDLIWGPVSQVLPFKRYINMADRVIAVSGAAAEFIERFMDDGKAIVIPNGVDVERFHDPKPVPKGVFDLARLEHPMVFSAGRLAFRKGFHLLLEAMPRVLSVNPGARLYVAGKGAMAGFLNMLVESLDLEDEVKLLGFVHDDALPWLYRSCDVFALPSVAAESFGITLIEAMAAGKPIVASRIGGVPEIIDDGVDGLLFEPWDSRGLSEAVNTLLGDPGLAAEMGRRAHAEAEERFSWPKVARRIEEVYEDVAS